jgi:hypothetical protein
LTVLTEIAILLLIEINIILLSTTELVEIDIPAGSDGPFKLAVDKSLLEESKTKNKTKNKTKRPKRK